jgi:hypothetical protein
MPHGSNCIIHFCGWCLEFFRTKLYYMWAISYCHFWDCISVYIVHLSTNSFIPGAKGGTLHFFWYRFFRCSIQRFYTNSYKSLILFYGSFLKLLTLWPAHTSTIASAILVPGWNPNLGYNFFSLILVRIHSNEFIQLLYKLYSTNSYTVWFLYQFIPFSYKLYSTNS